MLQKCSLKISSFYVIIAALANNHTLHSIDFSFNNLSGGRNPVNLNTLISHNKELRTLSMQDCMLGDEHLASLGRGFVPTS